jgi:hypothetical protein
VCHMQYTRVWNKWVVMAAHHDDFSTKVARWVRVLRNSKCAACFAMWRVAMAQQARAHSSMIVCFRRIKHLQCSGAWYRWMGAISYQENCCCALTRCLRLLRDLKCASSFRMWQIQIARSLEGLAVMARWYRAIRNAHARAVWHRWVASLRDYRLAAAQAQLMKEYESLRDSVIDRGRGAGCRIMALALGACVSRFKCQKLACAWEGWANQVRLANAMKGERTADVRKAILTIVRSQKMYRHSLLRKWWQCWRVYYVYSCSTEHSHHASLVQWKQQHRIRRLGDWLVRSQEAGRLALVRRAWCALQRHWHASVLVDFREVASRLDQSCIRELTRRQVCCMSVNSRRVGLVSSHIHASIHASCRYSGVGCSCVCVPWSNTWGMLVRLRLWRNASSPGSSLANALTSRRLNVHWCSNTVRLIGYTYS